MADTPAGASRDAPAGVVSPQAFFSLPLGTVLATAAPWRRRRVRKKLKKIGRKMSTFSDISQLAKGGAHKKSGEK
jgi:hypothetical protein